MELAGECLSVTYGDRAVLDAVNLRVGPGEIAAIVGPSGSGKSTLLHALAGVSRPTSGTVLWDESDVWGLGEAARTRLRRNLTGLVLQEAFFLRDLTLFENVAMPLRLMGGGRRDGRLAIADELLAAVGVEHRRDALPNEVSGGEAQRAALARALVLEPAILFADEPTGALDSENSVAVVDLIVGLSRERGVSVVMVTHDDEVWERADSVHRLADGALCAPTTR